MKIQFKQYCIELRYNSYKVIIDGVESNYGLYYDRYIKYYDVRNINTNEVLFGGNTQKECKEKLEKYINGQLPQNNNFDIFNF